MIASTKKHIFASGLPTEYTLAHNMIMRAELPQIRRKLFPDDVIFRSHAFCIAQDWEVPIPGFYVIASCDQTKRSIIQFDDDEIIELVSLQRLIRQSMMDVLNIEDVYFFQNEDSSHGFHIWIFPRHHWMDEKFGRKIQSVRPIMEYATESMANERVFAQIQKANKEIKQYVNHAVGRDERLKSRIRVTEETHS